MREISAEARAFLEGPSPHVAYQLEPDKIEAWRAAIRAGCAPFAESMAERLGVVTRDVDVGGVPCMEIIPPEISDRTILYCFGGGYVSGSAFEDLPISASLASLCKARVIAPHYRLAPEHPYPAALDDGLAVATAMAGPYALVGESAGGNLALAVAQRLRDVGAAMPVAMALLSPWCDLTHSGDSLTANDGRDPTLRRDDVEWAAAAFAGEAGAADPGVSPLFGDMSGLPATILTSGTRDLLLSPTVQLADALRDVGVEADLRIREGMWHVFEFYDVPEAEQSLREIAGFLDAAF